MLHTLDEAQPTAGTRHPEPPKFPQVTFFKGRGYGTGSGSTVQRGGGLQAVEGPRGGAHMNAPLSRSARAYSDLEPNVRALTHMSFSAGRSHG